MTLEDLIYNKYSFDLNDSLTRSSIAREWYDLTGEELKDLTKPNDIDNCRIIYSKGDEIITISWNKGVI